MEHVTQDIERLIVRRLDGALTADEELQLDRELIRNPEAHRLFEDYVRVDTLASEALRGVMGGTGEEVDMSVLTPRSPRRGWFVRYHRGWWLVPGAVAAALLAVMIPRLSLNQNVLRGEKAPDGVPQLVRQTPSLDTTMDSPSDVPTLTAPRGDTSDLMRSVSQYPVIRRRTGREVFGVMGDNGSIYWFEVDRTRTIHRASIRHQLRNSERL